MVYNQTQIRLYCSPTPARLGGVPEDVICGIGPVGKEEISVLKPSIGELLGIVHTLVESHNCCHFVGPAFSVDTISINAITQGLPHTAQSYRSTIHFKIGLYIHLLEVLEICIRCM